MAFNNNYGPGNDYRSRQNAGPRPQGGRPFQAQIPEEIRPLPLPADYVDAAEQVMRRLFSDGSRITTSKIRNLLSLVSGIYNIENLRTEPELLPDSQVGLTMMRIRMVYESGRDPATKTFVQEAHLLEYLKDIGRDRKKLVAYSHYMEALVAYHRYFGGKEN